MSEEITTGAQDAIEAGALESIREAEENETLTAEKRSQDILERLIPDGAQVSPFPKPILPNLWTQPRQ